MINPDDRLREFYSKLTVDELITKMAQSHKYQQRVMFDCFTRSHPVEKYVNALISSQAMTNLIVEIIIEKVRMEIKGNG